MCLQGLVKHAFAASSGGKGWCVTVLSLWTAQTRAGPSPGAWWVLLCQVSITRVAPSVVTFSPSAFPGKRGAHLGGVAVQAPSEPQWRIQGRPSVPQPLTLKSWWQVMVHTLPVQAPLVHSDFGSSTKKGQLLATIVHSAATTARLSRQAMVEGTSPLAGVSTS